jgi:unsaturated chondroitin disaccharide hydrolase
MMKKLTTITLSLLATASFAQNNAKQAIPFAEKQTEVMLKAIPQAKEKAIKPNSVSPRTLNTAGQLVLIPSKDWVSGFFPGELWYLYEFTHNKKWLEAAKQYTTNIEPEQFDKGTHDVGFKIYCSVGNGYRLTKDPHYKEVIVTAAKTLITRFNPKVGAIKSWDHRREWPYPVIIDNMMNLELLFEASKLSGDTSFRNVAIAHANTTLKNHFRPDFSSYHVIDYDPATGAVLHKQTHQGYADASAWARGQAWGLYGYTLCYRETKDPKYLKQAENIAKFILSNPNMPKDKVPYWDLNDPGIPNVPRDASAAAIMASAFYELSTYSANGKLYRKTADEMTNSLTKNYQAQPGGSQGFILLHSTGHKPANSEIDVPISYADYYYLEALLRQNRLEKGKPVVDL